MNSFLVHIFVIFSAVQLNVFTHGLCGRYAFPCESGSCIERGQWCDGKIHCLDSSDEKYCDADGHNKCNLLKYFQCDDGTCIPLAGKCDDYISCEDQSDESDETCGNSSTIVFSEQDSHVPADEKKSLYQQSDSPVFPEFKSELDKALKWLIGQRSDDFGWGSDTSRAFTALFLSRRHKFDDRDNIDMLMKKQLDVQIALDIERNSTKMMDLSDLALYINALLSTCANPRNFYGLDLVQTLRQRVAFLHNDPNTFLKVNPLAYITLCVANASNFQDAHKLGVYMERSLDLPLDMQAIIILAGSCLGNLPSNNLKGKATQSAMNLIHKIQSQGLPGNVYEASLLVLALSSLKFEKDSWKGDEAVKFILQEQEDGAFGDILATYYMIQVLSGKTLLSLRDHCQTDNSEAVVPVEVLKNTKRSRISVKYGLEYGTSVVMTQNLKMRVAEGTSFLDIMRLAQEANPNFRFRLDQKRKVPFVYSIGGIPNDAERGLYWKLYVRRISDRLNTNRSPHQGFFNGNIKELLSHDEDEFLFQMKPVIS